MVVTPSCYSADGWVTAVLTRHRIAARWREGMKLKGRGWAARDELERQAYFKRIT